MFLIQVYVAFELFQIYRQEKLRTEPEGFLLPLVFICIGF